MAAALQESFEDEAARRRRPGLELALPSLAELGAGFERQADGSDTCAIHSLNNIVQIPRSPEEAAAAVAAMVALAAAEANGERLDLDLPSSKQAVGPFVLKDLQRAEAESEREALSEGFLPQQLTAPKRQTSSRDLKNFPRTGMFAVEAVKVAAHAKGYEVIDVEPKPEWSGSDAERFVEATKKVSTDQSRRWFLGFLVYERIPGRAMHYYVIRYWPSKVSDEEGSWLILDSLDRGPRSPRNRLLNKDDLIDFYNSSSKWFRSWLVRWYPVVDRAAAVATLRNEVGSRIQKVCGRIPEAFGSLGISDQRAESTLEGDSVGWDLSLALEELLGAAELIERELQVLRLAVTERQARRRLEGAGWDFERAVGEQAKRLLGGSFDDSSAEAGRSHCSKSASYAALHLADWSARGAAQILLLHARAKEAAAADEAAESPEATPQSDIQRFPGSPLACSAEVPAEQLKPAMAALEACDWDMDKALEVLRLLCAERRAESRRKESGGEPGAAKALTEQDFARVLACAGFDTKRAARLLHVSRSFPSAPLRVCSEALRRADDCVVSAHALLDEFESRVCEMVAKVLRSCAKSEPDEKEVAEVARWTLEATEWNPAMAFPSAESCSVLLVQVRRDLLDRQRLTRRRAEQTIYGSSRGSQAPAAQPTEQEVADALATLDAMNAMERLRTTDVLEALKKTERPDAAVEALWRKFVGTTKRLPSKEAQSASAPPPSAEPPRSARRVSGTWPPAPDVAARQMSSTAFSTTSSATTSTQKQSTAAGSKTSQKKKKRGGKDECSLM